MAKKVFWLLTTSLIISAVILSGCNQGTATETTTAVTVTGTTTAGTTAVPTSATATTTTVAPTITTVVAPLYGGTLTHDVSYGNFMSWDQAKFTYQMNGYLTIISDGLLQGDFYKGPSGTKENAFTNSDMIPEGVVTGALAESWELPDTLTIIFHLRKGVNWQNKPPVNGREFTSADLVYHFERVIKARYPRHEFVEKVSAPDKYTFIVKMKRAMAYWTYEIGGYPYFVPQPKEWVDIGMEDWRNAVGTGPFMVSDYVPDSMITWVKNPNYYGKWTNPKDGKEYQLPFVDKMLMPMTPDEATWIAAVKTGKIDIGNFSPKWKEQMEKAAPLMINKEIVSMASTNIFFQLSKAPVNDIRVRRALLMAIDRKALWEATLFKTGNYLSPNTPMSPAEGPRYYPSMEEFGPIVQEIYSYNPTKAKELLAEAGYPKGFDGGAIVCSTGQQGASVIDKLTLVQAYWDAIGVKVTIENNDLQTWTSRRFTKDYNLFFVDGKGSTIRYFNEFTLNNWVANVGGFTSDKYEADWKAIQSEMDESKRAAMSKALMIYLWQQAPWFEMPAPSYYRCWWPWVYNFNGEQYLGAHNRSWLKYVWVDPALKKKLGY